MEYCSNGSLKSYLQNSNNGGKKITWKRKLNWSLEIVKGLMYLHSKKIIHRDMKSDNILIDDDLHAKITDFGISRIFGSATAAMEQQMTKQIGTSQYMAPEIALGQTYNEKCDIFSLGIIMYEIVTENTNPYGTYSTTMNIELQVCQNANFRPQVPSAILQQADESMLQYIELMKLCWNHQASQRPSTDEIIVSLEQCYSMLYNFAD